MPCITDEFYTTLEEYCESGEEIYIAAATRLYFSENTQQWQYTGVEGVSVVLKSNNEYYIRIYDIEDGELLFVQKLYKSFEYYTPQPWFHYFEIQEKIAGLSFASEAEAAEFSHNIKLCCEEVGGIVSFEAPKHEQKQPTDASTRSNTNLNNIQYSNVSYNVCPKKEENKQQSSQNMKTKKKSGLLRRILKGGKSGGGKEPLSIGNPTSFQHCGHIGFSGKGVVTDGIPLPLQQLFVAKIVNQVNINVEPTTQSHDQSQSHPPPSIPMQSEVPTIQTPVPSMSYVPPPPAPPPPPPSKVTIQPPRSSLLSEIQCSIGSNVAATTPPVQRGDGDKSVYEELRGKIDAIREKVVDSSDDDECEYGDDDDDEWW